MRAHPSGAHLTKRNTKATLTMFEGLAFLQESLTGRANGFSKDEFKAVKDSVSMKEKLQIKGSALAVFWQTSKRSARLRACGFKVGGKHNTPGSKKITFPRTRARAPATLYK